MDNQLLNVLQFVYNAQSDYSKIVPKLEKYLPIKKSAMYLAGRIYSQLIADEEVIPEIIMSWKALSEMQEEFADIRNQWLRDL